MILQRFYDEQLAQASYLIGCGASGTALVIDPLRDVTDYLEAAERERVRITHVTETHIHADFVSGARELANRTGAALLLSGEGGEDWQYAFAAEDGATLLHDGDEFRVGNIRIEAMHTPGHTPEHLSFIVTDGAAADEPIGAATGDFLFVGDVGRPDLLEKAAGIVGTMEGGARTLFASLQRFRQRFPDWLQIWPGHGAGSACGKGLSAIPHSTLGYEARFNWALSIDDETEFVRMVLEGQPEPPKYFAEMKRINREGPSLLGVLPAPKQLDETKLERLIDAAALVVDTRSAAAFAEAHAAGTINIPLNRSFTTYAGSLLPYDVDLHLITIDESAAHAAARDLAMIGLDRVAGYFDADVIHTWASRGERTERLAPMSADELAMHLAADDVVVVDVRSRAEYDAGHLPNAPNIPLGELPDRMDEIPADKAVVMHCQTGSRSAIAASLLQARGRTDVYNLIGGHEAWTRRQRAATPATLSAHD
jgi:hydroxyacylglutathione hydrolase